jgi:hypothetical protein
MTGRLILAATLLIVTNADAADVTIYSFENYSCGKWTSMRQRNPNMGSGADSWARGFISGYNWFNTANQVRRQFSKETITAYMDKFCRDHPLEDITAAVTYLICETHEGIEKPFNFCNTR